MTAPAAKAGSVRLRDVTKHREFEVHVAQLIVAGYTGSDAAQVEAHIKELAMIGVPAPHSIPSFYVIDPHLITAEHHISVAGGATSGEVEPVLIRHEGRFYLGVGSDHTDRDIERDSIVAAKAACPKPLGTDVFPLPDDLESFAWDQVRACSVVDGKRYQEGALAELRTPSDLLTLLDDSGEVDDTGGDLIIFTGTVHLLDGKFTHGRQWTIELQLPEQLSLQHTYEVHRTRPQGQAV